MTTRILIIDDEEEIRDLIPNFLRLRGFDFESEVAPDGAVGLEMFKRKPFDLVITDLFMPETEGLETIGELIRISEGVKILAISGGGGTPIGTDILIAAKRIGAHLTLEKPFNADGLIHAVRTLFPDR
ncbi:MAG: response regulator [Planctomycetota bacterium]